jgi:CO/xanthine dehydrogenase FAD-binding subunit
VQTFDYQRPATLGEAIAVLTRHGPDARILAGGTDLVVALRHGAVHPQVVVDIKGLSDLPAPVTETAGTLTIGATAVMADLVRNARIQALFPALVEAMDVVGSIQIRHRATLVGNICNASPAADTAPVLLVHGAQVLVTGAGGTRRQPVQEFVQGPRRTDLRLGELVTGLTLRVPARPTGTAFARMTRRRGVDLATVNLCCAVDSDGRTRFAYGAVAPQPFLVTDTTGTLADPDAPDDARDAALDALVAQASPITDVRAGKEYRLAMLRVLSRRALATAVHRLDPAHDESGRP